MYNEEYFIPWISNIFVNPRNNEILSWLSENVGREHWQLHGLGSQHPNCIRFERKEDALAFRLRFGDIK